MQHAHPDYQQRIQDTLPEAEGGICGSEPVFLLRAQDSVAAAVVRFWAFKVLQAGGDPATVAQALHQADAMDNWPLKKTPDAP